MSAQSRPVLHRHRTAQHGSGARASAPTINDPADTTVLPVKATLLPAWISAPAPRLIRLPPPDSAPP